MPKTILSFFLKHGVLHAKVVVGIVVVVVDERRYLRHRASRQLTYQECWVCKLPAECASERILKIDQ